MKDLQLFSFIIDDKSVDDINLKVFKLPNSVENVIRKLSSDKKYSVAYRTIFKVAISLFDKIIFSNNSLYDINKNNGIWFYSIEEFDLNLLKCKVAEWLKEEYKLRMGIELDETFSERWYFNEEISLKSIIKEETSIKYRLIPEYYIYKLAQNSFKFNSLEKELKFNRVIGENETTMMTMPIKLNRKIYTPFSYYITASLKKTIENVGLTLNFYLHVRIWDYRPLIKGNQTFIKGTEATSIYIYKENEYYFDKDILFNKVSLKRSKENLYNIEETADMLYIRLMDIDLKDILAQTDKFNDEKQECIALVINKNKKSFKTQLGAGLPERNEMLYLLKEKLPSLNLRDPITFLSKYKSNKFYKVTKEELELYNCHKYLNEQKPINKEPYLFNKKFKKILVYIATADCELYSKVISIMALLLRLDHIEENIYKSSDGYEIDFTLISNEFTRELYENENRVQRMKELEDVIGNGEKEVLRLAFIDIPNYHEDENYKDRDSKQLIRSAFKNRKVLTQFINYSCKLDEVLIDIIINSVKDLLSAAGFIESMIYKEKNIKQEDILIGISKIYGGSREKIVAMSKIIKGQIYINVFGVNKWMSIEEYIFSINNNFINKSSISGKQKEVMQEIDEWIQENLSEILENKQMVYVFVDCNLRNGLWKFAKNDNFLNLELLRIPNKEYLRLIRINNSDEIPEYFIYDKKYNINKNSGIFKSCNSTYYLVGRRIETDTVIKNATKCSIPNKPLKRPSLYEINIQGTENEEEKDFISKLTQDLRGMNISYDSHASLPLPLYCIRRLTEYIKAEKEIKM